jgi:hypothetical protein
MKNGSLELFRKPLDLRCGTRCLDLLQNVEHGAIRGINPEAGLLPGFGPSCLNRLKGRSRSAVPA